MSMSTNNDVYANTEARKAIRSRLAAAHSLLVNYGAYEDAMNSRLERKSPLREYC